MGQALEAGGVQTPFFSATQSRSVAELFVSVNDYLPKDPRSN